MFVILVAMLFRGLLDTLDVKNLKLMCRIFPALMIIFTQYMWIGIIWLALEIYCSKEKKRRNIVPCDDDEKVNYEYPSQLRLQKYREENALSRAKKINTGIGRKEYNLEEHFYDDSDQNYIITIFSS